MNKLPQFLIDKIKNQYGEELLNKIISGYESKKKVTVRVNTINGNLESVKESLKSNNINYSKSDFYENALIIESETENKIKSLSIYENGEIYLQSLSSMLPPIVLSPKENEDILDMTAAPGGKTTQMAAMTNNKSHITA